MLGDCWSAACSFLVARFFWWRLLPACCSRSCLRWVGLSSANFLPRSRFSILPRLMFRARSDLSPAPARCCVFALWFASIVAGLHLRFVLLFVRRRSVGFIRLATPLVVRPLGMAVVLCFVVCCCPVQRLFFFKAVGSGG